MWVIVGTSNSCGGASSYRRVRNNQTADTADASLENPRI
jgi:hypothetical protein